MRVPDPTSRTDSINRGSMSETTSETAFYRHAPRSLIGDYVRALIGLGITLTVFFSLDDKLTIVGGIFFVLSLLFLAFGLRTLRQQLLRVAINDEGIFTKVFGTASLPWSKLSYIRLRFFGTRREHKSGSGGHMQLTLKGDGQKLSFDSTIEGFPDILWHAARAARHNGLGIDPSTAGNMLSLGIEPDKDTRRPT